MQFVSPDYFKTLNIPILLGRDFRMTDASGAPKVCIVNEKFAKRYFTDGNALGRHIGMGGDPGTKLDIEIIGVVRDIEVRKHARRDARSKCTAPTTRSNSSRA